VLIAGTTIATVSFSDEHGAVAAWPFIPHYEVYAVFALPLNV